MPISTLVLPLPLEEFNVLLFIFCEVFILAIGNVLTKHLYGILIKWRFHRGHAVRIRRRRKTKFIPFAEDLHFEGIWERAICISIRMVLLFLTIAAGLQIGSVPTYAILGESNSQLVLNTQHQEIESLRSHYGHAVQRKAQQACEVVNTTHISFKAALMSSDSSQFSCHEGIYAEEEDILILKWRVDELTPLSDPISVNFSVSTATAPEVIYADQYSEKNGDGTHYIQFRQVQDRQFFIAKNYRGVTRLELVKPRFKDFFIYTANQINHDRANNVEADLSVARSFANHAMWTKLSKKQMTGDSRSAKATMSILGIYFLGFGAAIVTVLTPVALLVLKAPVSYILLDPTDAIGLVSLCVEAEKGICTESIDSIAFAITDRGDVQYLGILPGSLSPARRDKTRPMDGGSFTLHTAHPSHYL